MEQQLLSITTKLYIPNAIDNIFNSNYLLSRLRKTQKSFDGGTSIAIPIEFDELTSGGSFTGLELLNTSVNDVTTLAEYNWRHYYVTVGWSRDDYLKNKGSKTQIVNMVSMLTKNASKKMQKMLTSGIFASSKVNASDIDGLSTSITAASTTACGGLTSSDFSTWAAQRDTTTTKLTLSAMNTQYRAAADGPDAPTIVVTTDAIFGYYYDIATPLQRYGNEDAAKQGFTTLTFNGIPVVSDKACTSGAVYMLNEDHLWLAAHSDEDMRYKEPQEPLNQAASLGQIFWFGNVITDARRRQAVLTAITA
jgi:hypothetical protein